MSDPTGLRASVLITNFNYGRFVGYAVESALAQTWPNVQVVVVDDGSTDESRALLETYGDSIQTIYKENGGQASCIDAGMPLITGDALILLDSDDMLDPTAIEKTIGFFADPNVVKVHWPMATVDRDGFPTGQIRWQNLPSGSVRRNALKVGPASHVTPACSANIWRRSFFEALLPFPGGALRNIVDSTLFTFAPFFGEFRAWDEPLTFYRMHGKNQSSRFAAGGRLQNWEDRALVLQEWLAAQGETVSIDRWRRNNKYVQRLISILKAEDQIGKHLPKAAPIALVAGQHYDRGDMRPVRPVHRAPESYLEPERTESDFRELIDQLRASDLPNLVVQGPSTWRGTNLTELATLLRTEHTVIFENDWIIIAEIRPATLTPA